jgi:GNAT superfamily N-acetyltransferase
MGTLDSWDVARTAAHTQLAIIDGHVAGFTDLDDHGYIHTLFVDPDFGRHGVASALLTSMVALARQRRPTGSDHLCQPDIPTSVRKAWVRDHGRTRLRRGRWRGQDVRDALCPRRHHPALGAGGVISVAEDTRFELVRA